MVRRFQSIHGSLVGSFGRRALAAPFIYSIALAVQAQSGNFDRTVTVDISSEPLAAALIDFSKQTGIQVITAGSSVKGLSTHGVHGEMPASSALRHLLEGTSLGFHALGPNTVGIDTTTAKPTNGDGAQPGSAGQSPTATQSDTRGGPPTSPPATAGVQSATSTDMAEILVTARKQSESIIDVPESISVLSGEDLTRMEVQSFTDYASKIPDLSFSYGTGSLGFADSRTVAIRGISGAGTTAIYIDDTPVDEAMDPRVLDIARIEVLKGPQGTLFGEGSLGGAVRLISQQPSFTGNALSYTAAGGTTSHGGSADYDASAIANVVPVDDVVALRAVAFVTHDAGFITRNYPLPNGEAGSSDNQGAKLSFGGSLTALIKINDRFDVTARLLTQNQDNYGLPVAYAPLPDFSVVSLDMDRAVNLQEYANEHWVMPSLQLNYRGDGWDLVSATSYLQRSVTETEDDTEGTVTASQNFFGYTPQPVVEPWYQSFKTQHLTEEIRSSFTGHSYLNGTVGAYYSEVTATNIIGPYEMPGLTAAGLFPTDLGWYSWIKNSTDERALFGEAYISPVESTTLTLGARQYWLHQQYQFYANGLFNGGSSQADTPNGQSGVSPKAAIEYKLDRDASVYASASKGFRAGGGTTPLPPFCAGDLAAIGLNTTTAEKYTSDTVWNYEIGSKMQVLDRRLLLTGALYQVNWTDIQQPVFLPNCGFTFTTNAGAARSRGAEFEMSGQLVSGLTARLGVGYDDAIITEQGRSNEAPGSPVREVPKTTATVSLEYSHPLTSEITGIVSGDSSYIGSSISAINSPTAPLVRPSYSILNLRFGLERGRDELSLFAKNVTNSKANLGDINPIGYVRYQDDVVLPRVAVLQPLTIGIRYRHGF
jgi:outer membrane receptor protein involved in Fe transport